MKKYLIKGLLALVVGGFTASCADKDGEYVPMDQQKEAAYAEVFKELIGGEVAPNHDWGFKKTSLIDESSQARANTRGGSDPNTAIWPDYGYPTKPGELKATTPSGKSEEQIVTEWFQNHTIADAVTLDCNNYWVLQVHYKDYNYTVNQHEFEKYENGQEVWKTATTTVSPWNHMDQIYANKDANSTSYDHIYNFNTNSGSFMLVRDSETKYGFGYEESWGTSDKHVYNRSFMAHIVDEANGIDGYYVGFDYQTYKKSNPSYRNNNGETITYYDNKDWAYEPDGIYDDRIIKIVPGTAAHEITPGGETSSSSTSTRIDRIERSRLVAQGRVFCEDLGTDVVKMDLTDIDFNDAVFDAKIWRMGQFDITYIDNTYNSESDYLENIYTTGINGFDIETTGGDAHVIVNGKFKYVAEICILAAGGTIPLKIGGNNGFEIHEKFGVGHTTIVNTMGEPSGDKVNIMVTNVTRDAVTVNVDITDLVKAAIKKGNTDISLDIIPIEVLWKNGEYRGVSVLQAGSVGSEEDIRIAPQKLCVDIGTPWVYERIPITSAYRDFAEYAKSRTPLFWEGSTNRNPSLLYPSIEGEMVALEGETGNVNTNPYDDNIVIPGTTTTTTVTETVLWEGEITFANSSSGTSSEEFTLYSKDFAVGDKMRIYGEATGNDPWVSIHAVNGSWINYAGCAVTSPYSDIVVTQDMIDKITLTTALWGKFCKVTKITKVVTTTN